MALRSSFMTSLEELLFKNNKTPNGTTMPKPHNGIIVNGKPKKIGKGPKVSPEFAQRLTNDFARRRLASDARTLKKQRTVQEKSTLSSSAPRERKSQATTITKGQWGSFRGKLQRELTGTQDEHETMQTRDFESGAVSSGGSTLPSRPTKEKSQGDIRIDKRARLDAGPGPETTAVDKELFELLNQLRADPASFIKHLEALKGTDEYDIDDIDEAIEVLENKDPVAAIQWSPQLSQAAQIHVEDAGPVGAFGHIGTDDSAPIDRIKLYDTDVGSMGALVYFGEEGTAMDILCTYLIDELDPKKTNRNMLFAFWDKFGCASGPHAEAKNMSTLYFCQAIETSRQLLTLAVNMWEEDLEEPEMLSEDCPTGWIKKNQEVRLNEGIIVIKNVYTYKDADPKIIEATITHYKE